jgi:hypothetical protein
MLSDEVVIEGGEQSKPAHYPPCLADRVLSTSPFNVPPTCVWNAFKCEVRVPFSPLLWSCRVSTVCSLSSWLWGRRGVLEGDVHLPQARPVQSSSTTEHVPLRNTLKVNVKVFLCWTKHHVMKTCLRNGGIAPHILNLGTRWRWVLNFLPLPEI